MKLSCSFKAAVLAVACLLGTGLVACKDRQSAHESGRSNDPHAGLGVTAPARKIDEKTTALFKAIAAGSIANVTAALDAGASLEARDQRNNTPLVAAVINGKADVLAWLIKKGAPLEAVGGDGATALLRAVAESRTPEAILLIKAGANVNTQGRADYLRATPLFVASGLGNMELIQLLLEAGADVNKANELGVTPLMDAAHGSPGMVKALLSAGADTSLQDMEGNTALKIAKRQGQNEIVKMLKNARSSRAQDGKKKGASSKAAAPSR